MLYQLSYASLVDRETRIRPATSSLQNCSSIGKKRQLSEFCLSEFCRLKYDYGATGWAI